MATDRQGSTPLFLLLLSSCHDPYTNRHLKQIERREGESSRKDVIEHHFLMRFAHSFPSINVRF